MVVGAESNEEKQASEQQTKLSDCMIDPENFVQPMENNTFMLPFGIASLAVSIFFIVMIIISMLQLNVKEETVNGQQSTTITPSIPLQSHHTAD